MSEKESSMGSENPNDWQENEEALELKFDQEIIDYNARVIEKNIDNILKYYPEEWPKDFIDESGLQINLNLKTGKMLDYELDSLEDWKNSSPFHFDVVFIGEIIKVANPSRIIDTFSPFARANVMKAMNKFNNLNKKKNL